MFTSISMRSVSSYSAIGLETSVTGASPHQLVSLLFAALQQSLSATKGAILNGDISAKGRSVSRAVRILEEGLKAGLDNERGGDLAANLRSLYDYCIIKTTEANLRNDAAMIDEVLRLIHPVSDGWNQIRDDAAVRSYHS